MYIDTPPYIQAQAILAEAIGENELREKDIVIEMQNDQMLVCLTLYNESDLPLLLTIYSLALSIAYYYERTNSTGQISVCLIADGAACMSPSATSMLESIGMLQQRQCNKNISLFDSRIEICKLEQYLFQHIFQKEAKGKWDYLYQHWLNENRAFLPVNSALSIRTLVCIKHENKGKLNSHWWFFRYFNQQLNPEFCFQLDTGTMPGVTSVYEFWSYMNKNLKTGAAASRVIVPSGVSCLKPLQSWQYGDFVYQKLFDWPAELMSGYLTVLPGQFCMFRTKALKNHKLTNSNKSNACNDPLDYYFRGLNQLGVFESNMFLAEDRVLGYEIISKGDSEWRLGFVPSATSTTDTCDTLHELFRQRRRWINSAFTCNLWLIVKILAFLKNSPSGYLKKVHTLMSVPWLIFNNIAQWLYPAAMLIVLNIAFKHFPYYFSVFHFSVKAGTILLGLFCALMLLQIVVFYKARLFNKRLVFVKFSAVFQFIIIMLGLFWYAYYQISKGTGGAGLLVILLFEIVFLLITAALYRPHLLKGIIKHFMPYFLFRPVMLLLLIGYSFSNMHDCSWGTKGLYLKEKKPGDMSSGTCKPFNVFRLCMFFAWVSTNSLLIYHVIKSDSSSTDSIENIFIGLLIGFVGFKTLSGLLFALTRYIRWKPKQAIGKLKPGIGKTHSKLLVLKGLNNYF